MISEVEIKNLAKKYGFKYKILNGVVFIESKYDSWYVECREYGKFPLVLYHQIVDMIKINITNKESLKIFSFI